MAGLRTDWRVKAAIQHVLSALPAGHRLNLVLQRRAFHNLPVTDSKLATKTEIASEHVERFTRHCAVPLDQARFFEFGAGWDLALPQALYCFGVDHQRVVDLRPLAVTDLVLDVARRLPQHLERSDRRPSVVDGDLDAHLAAMGIEYVAPSDASATGLTPGQVDCVTSTNTLEHIPPDQIAGILSECRRILSPDGCMSFRVDYQDHYSYFDGRRTPYSFLAYDDRAWKRWNPSLHFQNRLRHHEYLTLYEAAGFDVVDERAWGGDAADLALLAATSLAPEFAALPPELVAVRGAWVVLKPRRNKG
jgi:SAM-dependent methyltransferase